MVEDDKELRWVAKWAAVTLSTAFVGSVASYIADAPIIAAMLLVAAAIVLFCLFVKVLNT